MSEELNIVCPDCEGDGIAVCHNPDHGFYIITSGVLNSNESACPVCGHREDHKIIDEKCETCNGIGKISIEKYKLLGEQNDNR